MATSLRGGGRGRGARRCSAGRAKQEPRWVVAGGKDEEKTVAAISLVSVGGGSDGGAFGAGGGRVNEEGGEAMI